MRERVVLDDEPRAVGPDAVALPSEPRDGAGGAVFTPVTPASSSAGSALWRRWAELQRASDSLAETQVCFRPRASEPRRDLPARDPWLEPAPLRVDRSRVIPPPREASASRGGPAPVAPVVRPEVRRPLDVARLLASALRAARGAFFSRWAARRQPKAGRRRRGIARPLAPRRAALFGLGAVCVGALAAGRPSGSATAAKAPGMLRATPSPARPAQPAQPHERTSAPSREPPSWPGSRPPSRGASDDSEPGASSPQAHEPPELERLTRLAVDALAAGDRRTAAAHYRELARRAPDNAGFVAAARILGRGVGH
jgi:hypothetical protein